MKDLRKEYKVLESKVKKALFNKVRNSELISEFTKTKFIEVNSGNFLELTIIEGELTLININGYHYGLHVLNLDELIDLI